MVYGPSGEQVCRHWEPHTDEFSKWEAERYGWLEKNVEIPASVLPAWNDRATLVEECLLRSKNSDSTIVKKTTTMANLEKFLMGRCRKGAKLTANKAEGVRWCCIDIVRADLEERKLYKVNMDEGEQRRVLEQRLRLEDEKTQMKVLMRDKRFEDKNGNISDDVERVLIDTLHAPMRMNEKVLHILFSVAHNNKTKKTAGPTFAVVEKKLREMAIGPMDPPGC